MFYNIMSVFYGYELEEGDFLNRRKGGDINNDINMNGNQIVGISHTPSRDDSAVNRKYVIDNILGNDYFRKRLSETLFEEYRAKNNHSMYSVDKIDAIYLILQGNNIRSLVDQGLNEAHANQRYNDLRPIICTKADRVNSRYYIRYDTNRLAFLDSSINLRVVSPSKDIVNVFMVYLIKGYNLHGGSSGSRNCLFTTIPVVSFCANFTPTGTLAICGAVGGSIKIGPDNNANYPYKSKANAGELNKWIVLSIHFDNHTSPAGNNTSVYCNGKKLADFKSTTCDSRVVTTRIGSSMSSGYQTLYGYIGHFMVYKSLKMSERDILLHHRVMIDRWSIDVDE